MHSKNILILALSQALGNAGVSAVVLVGGILGARLAPSQSLATLPMSLMVVGTAVTIIPSALLMRRIGRRLGFIYGAMGAVLAALLAAYAVTRASFGLFCLAAVLIGANSAFTQQFRFAAAESAPAGQAGRAVSFVLVGGMVAGIIGPDLARRASRLLPVEFSGSFIAMAGLYALSAGLLLLLRDVVPGREETHGRERPLLQIARQPAFLIAVFSGAVAYGVMSFIMTATPVHMNHIEHFDLAQTALVIQSHIIAMYLPSLFSGFLLERFGSERVMLAGLACLFATVAIGVVSRELLHYWWALVLLGVGWNFLFVGGTLLLTRSYQPAERFKSQAANDFSILAVQSLTSLSAGSVLFAASWDVLNLMALPFLLLNLAALAWLWRRNAPIPALPEAS